MADKHRNALSEGYEIEGYRIEAVLRFVCRRTRWWSVLTGENFYCRKSNGIIALRPRC